MRPSPVQIFVGDKRMSAGRVPRKFISGVLVRIRNSSLTDGIACFPCPFCEQEITANGSTSCNRCEAELAFTADEQEVIFVASRNPQTPLI